MEGLSTSELETRLKIIDQELEQLARLSLRGGVGTTGYRSGAKEVPDSPEWIQIDLGAEVPINEIVLVPSIWRDTKTGFRADGFPESFQIFAGKQGETTGTLIADFTAGSFLPRIAPVVIPISHTVASWIRLECDIRTPRVWDGRYIVQLAEIMVFSGEENVALHRPITTLSDQTWMGDAVHTRFLVDGFGPYLMDSGRGEQSNAYQSPFGAGTQPSLTLDLESPLPVNRIHLHPPDLGDTIPQSAPDGFALPKRMEIEGAMSPDFSDSVTLCTYQVDSPYDTGPILMRRFPEVTCRYVRLVATEPYMAFDGQRKRSLLGFGEIEIFSAGQNVALGKKVEANYPQGELRRSLRSLTDGRNFYGTLLPLRSWMSELARRHELETERPIVSSLLQKRYDRQKTALRRLGWLSAMLLACMACIVLIDRMLRQRLLHRTRERIAANLHDELGANLHAIGLLGDLAKEEVHNRSAEDEFSGLVDLVDEIRSVTEITGTTARNCVNMLGSPDLYQNLLEEMTKVSKLMLADLSHEFVVEGEEFLSELDRRATIDIYLFYKECLTNILSHSGATRVTTEICATRKEIRLTVDDNGRGLRQSIGAQAPSSLKRRARLLRAHLTSNTTNGNGTSITLIYRRRKRWRRQQETR